jgi:RNA polymerase sigma-70 factor, ECF subfamily
MLPRTGEVTQLLIELKNGDRVAEQKLIPLVYNELRRLAARQLRGEKAAQSLQPTALVHEAYIRLTGIRDIDWQGRTHFFAVAARLMRRILVDRARAHDACKRGGLKEFVTFDEGLQAAALQRSDQLMELDEALDRLEQLDPRQARVVELRFFAGLTEDETAEILGISSRTVKREWRTARAWLYSQVG